jgi:hypothetical protein
MNGPDEQEETPDSGAVALDGGAAAPDAGFAADDDAGEESVDAADPTPDAGSSTDAAPAPDADRADSGSPDAGQLANDAGSFTPDASAPPPDAGSAPTGLNPGWIGGACQTSADCPFTDGECLTEADGWPQGTCTAPCSQFCPDQSGPLNAVTFCIDDGDGDASGACLSRCDFTLSPTGCREGYVCLPEKRMNQPSVVRYACVPNTGVPDRAAPAFDIGAPCTTAADCERNTCITDLPGGYCTQEACDVVGCPAGSACFGLGQEGFNVCLETCTVSNECRTSEGYACDTDSTCWYLPPPAGTCDLADAAADCADYAAQATPTFVVVTKHLRRLAHGSGPTLLGADCVGLGSSPVEDKEREGDRRTPEGVFYIPRTIPNSQFYKAFLLSYPDIEDAMRGLAAGLITQSEYNAIVAAQNAGTEPPQHTNLGGLIEIHGGGSGGDWTWGCIAMDNSAIDILWPTLDAGDTIVVLH